jgi:hypothetical protein
MVELWQTRCPRLGGEVTFGYCKREGGDIPCPRTLLCWQGSFAVEVHLRETLTAEQWDRCFNSKPKEKIASLIELIEESRRPLGESA